MKLSVAVVLGVLASFGLTILGELAVIRSRAMGTHLPFAELAVGGPFVALTVGAFIGLIAKERARVAAALGLAPWIAVLLIGAGRGHSGFSWWTILITATSIYLALGIAAAALVGRRMVRASSGGSHSPFQGHS
jgi:hypothetical protein